MGYPLTMAPLSIQADLAKRDASITSRPRLRPQELPEWRWTSSPNRLRGPPPDFLLGFAPLAFVFPKTSCKGAGDSRRRGRLATRTNLLVCPLLESIKRIGSIELACLVRIEKKFVSFLSCVRSLPLAALVPKSENVICG